MTPTTKQEIDLDNNEWLEQFLNNSDTDLIDITTKETKQKESQDKKNELNIVEVENILEIKNKATFFYQNGRYSDAIKMIEEALRLLPGDLELNYFYAQCFFMSGNLERAHIILSNLLTHDDNKKFIPLTHLYGYCLLKMEKFTQAEKFLKEKQALFPQDTRIQNMLGYALERQNKLIEARDLVIKILTRKPNDPNANNSLAYIYYRLKMNLEEGRQMAMTALNAEPENPSFLDTFGMISFELGDINNARINLQKALSIEPTNKTLLEHLNQILEA